VVRDSGVQILQYCDVLYSTRRSYMLWLVFDLSKVTTQDGRNNEVQVV
jgi:hypothetical protein